MDSLARTYQQLNEMLRAMTPGARTAAAVLAVLVVVCLGYLVSGQVATSDTYLLGGESFSASQLREIQAALGKAGLEAELDGLRIKVPRGQETKYMAALAEAGALPAEFGGYLKQAVAGSGFGLYGPQQEARMKVAIQSELQAVIGQMKGIERAFVHIEEDRKRGFREQAIVTASVGIQPRSGQPLDEGTVAAIRSLVASARPPLVPEAVTVVDLSGPRLFAGAAPAKNAAGGALANYSDLRKRLEQDWEEKIGRLLAQIVPGALVTASVELANEAPLEPGTASAAGAPGRAAESPAPRRVTVSIAVPSTHYETVWRQRGGPQAGPPDATVVAELEATERRRIESVVAPLLGRIDSPHQPPPVNVITYYPPTISPTAASSSSETQPAEAPLALLAWAWLVEHAGAVSLAMLGLVALLLLRSIVRGSSPVAAAQAVDGHDDNNVALVLSSPDDVLPLSGNRDGVPPRPVRVREELADVVRQDPQAALSVLRSWIGNPV